MTEKDKHGPPHIENLIDAVEYAMEVLDDYSDVEDGEDGLPTPNRAMVALVELREAYQRYIRVRVALHGEPE